MKEDCCDLVRFKTIKTMLEYRQDEGYAWVISIIGNLSYFLILSSQISLGVIILPMTQSLGFSFFQLSWIGGFASISSGISGFFIGPIIKRYGGRVVKFFGSVLIFTAYTISALFVKNIYILYLLMGVSVGIGSFCIGMSTILILPFWFKKKKSLAFSIVITGTSVGIFAWGPLIYFLEKKYTWRGAILIQAAILLNGCVLAALQKDRPDNDSEALAVTEKKKPLTEKLQTHTQENLHVSQDGIRKKSKSGATIMKLIFSVIDKSIFKNISLMILMLGKVAMFMGHVLPLNMLPTKATLVGLDPSMGPYLVSSIALASGSLRVFIGYLADKAFFNRYLALCIAPGVAGALTIISGFLKSFILLEAYAVGFGFVGGKYDRNILIRKIKGFFINVLLS